MLNNMSRSRLKRWLVKRSLVKSIICHFLPSGLYVFNYHRIGSIENNLFDDNVFSCNACDFESQIIEIKKHFTLIRSEDIRQYFGKKITEKLALVTFDDGYIDNYQLAYPLLKKHDVSAMFFVPTGYIDASNIPWWDQIAFAVKTNIGNVNFWDGNRTISVTKDNHKKTILNIIRDVKEQRGLSNSDYVDNILLANTVDFCSDNIEKLFMNWSQLIELSDNGMLIGSHSVHHNILVSLDAAEQEQELKWSKESLDVKLSQDTISFAYPVGSAAHFNTDIKKLLKDTGYQYAFSNEPGCNNVIEDVYSINRFSINKETVFDVLFDHFLR
jgi:peptidoglycan/xylan/chitin deacetylase (PgdA/CDA1 family)